MTVDLLSLIPKTLSVITVTSNYTITQDDDMILVDASGGAITITMPTAEIAARFKKRTGFYIKKIDSTSNNITIQGV